MMCAMQLAIERLRQMEHVIQARQQVRVIELSEMFGVSEPTIRRDLQKLEEMGRARREHGGAIAVTHERPESPVIHRMTECAEEKRRIGAATAALIHDGETIFLGSGTTTQEVARNLIGKRDLTVITNALTIANLLADNADITLIITGGVLRHSELSMIGHIVEQTLRELRADKVIISMPAISVEEGLTNSNLLETMTDRVILQFAREVILVADHTKFGKASTSIIGPVTSVQTVVTDDSTPVEMVDQLRALGIMVVRA